MVRSTQVGVDLLGLTEGKMAVRNRECLFVNIQIEVTGCVGEVLILLQNCRLNQEWSED